jgi:two-component system LytT family sensor kinase
MQAESFVIEIEDDGVGIVTKSETAIERRGAGIGLKNVRERLEVLYGTHARFTVVSRPGRGTLVSIEIPYDPEADEIETRKTQTSARIL